ncbi:hypothetical protein LguiB_018562 [Lonicera macranthoides]
MHLNYAQQSDHLLYLFYCSQLLWPSDSYKIRLSSVMKSVLLAEAEAILYGLFAAPALGYPNIVVESDHMSIIHFIAHDIEAFM